MNEINDNSNETKEVVRSHHQKLSSLLSLFEFSFIVPTENKVNMLTNTQVGSPLINYSPLSSNSTFISLLSEKFRSDKNSLKKVLTSSSFLPKNKCNCNNNKKKKKKHVHFGKNFVEVINVQNYKKYNIMYNNPVVFGKKRRILYGGDSTKCTCNVF